MKKMVYFYEKVVHTHAVEVEVESEDELEQFIDDVNDGDYDNADEAITELSSLGSVQVNGIEKDYDIDIDEVECDSKDTDELECDCCQREDAPCDNCIRNSENTDKEDPDLEDHYFHD